MGGPPIRRFLCLFWRETRQRIFGPEISPYPEVVRGRERELVGQRSWQVVGDGTAELAWNHWQMRSTPETVADKIGSSEEDWVKMSAFQLLVELSLVTHACVSPHMHVVFHTLLLLWVNPKHCSCLFVRLFYFLLSPRSYSCMVARNVRYPPRTTSWSPAKKWHG